MSAVAACFCEHSPQILVVPEEIALLVAFRLSAWYNAGIGMLPELNTLVLKQNQIKELGNSLHGCTGLSKLSLAHNK